MSLNRWCRLILGVALAGGAIPVSAQSMTVLDSGEDARRCSLAAEMAATMRSASSGDVDYCDRALELAALRPHERAGTYVNRGIIRSVLGENTAALRDYDRALRTEPGLPEAWVGRGNLRFIEGDIAGAIAEYDRALGTQMSRRHIVLLNRGMALEARGDLDAAERDYREALQLRPEWPLAASRIDRVVARRAAPSRAPPEP